MTALATNNARSRQQWAEIICSDWRQSIDSIIQTGRDLAEAKAELPHGEFERMVSDDLPFTTNTARCLMAVAKHPSISNQTSSFVLPPSWAVLSELTKLSETDFADAQQRGLISPKTTARDARAISTAYHTPAGGTVGDPKKPAMLPPPVEARKIARETGRFVAASDGNIYSGATEEEGQAYAHKRNVSFRILEAIQTLSGAPDARKWLSESESHWFVDFRPGDIDDACDWLKSLKTAMEIVDAH